MLNSAIVNQQEVYRAHAILYADWLISLLNSAIVNQQEVYRAHAILYADWLISIICRICLHLIG